MKPTNADLAIEEIKTVVQKYDLAAMVVLQAADQVTFLNELSPSWSCARFDETTGQLRIRAKREDYDSREEQKRIVEATVGMVLSFLRQAERNVENYTTVAAMLGDAFESISHREDQR